MWFCTVIMSYLIMAIAKLIDMIEKSTSCMQQQILHVEMYHYNHVLVKHKLVP